MKILSNKSIFHTDYRETNKGVTLEKIFKFLKIMKKVNYIELTNLTIRQRISRLAGKILLFSKIDINHIWTLKYFFYKHNI